MLIKNGGKFKIIDKIISMEIFIIVRKFQRVIVYIVNDQAY